MLIIDMSYPEHTQFGKKLNKMWYNSKVYTLVEYHGYPHNGGEHTFWFKAKKADALAFLDIFDETFGAGPETVWVRECIEAGERDILLRKYRNHCSKEGSDAL